jgi:hypothetical protein
MKFYSGFSLKDESYLFTDFINPSDFTVCGFSYGAIPAFESVLELLREGRRIDTLQLFSPAFFQSKDAKFKRLQLMSYKKNQDVYMQQFVDACFAPYNKKIVEHKETTIEELQELLEYVWDIDLLKFIEEKGVKIEVYLGGKDAIVDSHATKEFFQEVATVTYIKEANHFLQLN